METEKIRKGEICCLLCRVFISYKNSDRTKFLDHMVHQHNVKFDSDLIMAVSVLSAREKQNIVDASVSRLTEIGNNQLPSSAPQAPAPGYSPNTVVPAPASSSRVPVPVTSRAAAASPSLSSRGRGGVSSSSAAARERGSYHGTVTRPQLSAAPKQLAAANAACGKAPFNIQNMSISISVVDQTAKCTQCPMTFKNSVLLAEHTKTVHLAMFVNPGFFITAPEEKHAACQKTAGARAIIQSPGGENEPVVAAQQQQGGISSQHQQFIKQSVFKDHKMGYLKEKNASDVPAAQPDSKEVLSRNDGSRKGRVIQRIEEKQVDSVDLGEVSDEYALEEPGFATVTGDGDGTSVPESSTINAESNYNSTGTSDLLLAQVVCEHCGKICKDDVALKHHFYIVHRNNVENLPKLFSCKSCPKQFCQLNKLNRHMITHDKLRKYTCSACKTSFSRSDTLKNHVKVFHNEAILKMFTCNICSKTYHYKKDLNRHIKNVHSNK